MPELDGISATAMMQTIAPQSAVILLSIYDDVSTRARAQAAGAAAFVHKSGEIDVLIATIRDMAKQKKM
jgi:two-component system, NarL family, response regulator DegU